MTLSTIFSNFLTIIFYFWQLALSERVLGHQHLESTTFPKRLTKHQPFSFTSWPLKSGFPGLVVVNLNEYLSLFPQCLTVVNNHQGIEILEWPNAIYLFRFDRAIKEMFYSKYNSTYNLHFDLPFEQISNMEIMENKTSSEMRHSIKVSESRWTCYAHFDLFYPEISDAPQFYDRKNPQVAYGKYYNGKIYIRLVGLTKI